jgi:hypothetical protein
MPKNNKKIYTQENFEEDINELENLINEYQEGGDNNEENNNNNNENNNNNYENNNNNYENNNNNYENNNNEDSDEDNYEDEENHYGSQNGGKKEYTGTYRHFKIVEVNGKPIKLDAIANIKEHQTPISAAKKLLRSYCRAKKLSENDRLKLHIVFSIKETNRGSNNKIFGPYSGKYRKYTAKELQSAVASGITFHMKPEVRLHKEKMQKGG